MRQTGLIDHVPAVFVVVPVIAGAAYSFIYTGLELAEVFRKSKSDMS